MYTRRMGAARTRKFLLLGETLTDTQTRIVGTVDAREELTAFAKRRKLTFTGA